MDNDLSTLLSAPAPELDNLSFALPAPESVGEWISRLPMANVTETAGQIRQATFEIARLETDWKTRMSLLEGIRPTVLYLTARLDKAANSTGNQADAITRLAQRLQTNLCSGYKAVVLTARDEAELDADEGRYASLAIHRALSDLSRTLLRTLQYYVAPADKLWLTLHQLYYLAEQLGIQDELHADTENKAGPDLSITSAYQRSLLLALARPYQLRHRELAEAFNAIGNWAHLISLSEATAKNLYQVDLNSDQGPGPASAFSPGDGANLRGIDSNLLVNELEAFLQDAPKEPDSLLIVPPGIERGLISHLADAWGEMKPRAFSRADASDAVRISIGLRPTHYFLSGDIEFADYLSGNSGDGDKPAAANPFLGGEVHFLPNAGEHQDVWENAFDVEGRIPENPNIDDGQTRLYPHQAPPSPGSEPAYRQFETTAADMSPSGYRLRWSEPFPPNLQTGELIGLRDENDSRWCLAVARWIRQDDEGPFMGVELLAPQAKAVAVRLIQSKGGKPEYQRAFLLPELKPLGRPATLVTPASPFQAGHKLHLKINGTQSTAQLGDCLLKTGSFNQFSFRVLDGYLEKPGSHPNMVNLTNNNQLGIR